MCGIGGIININQDTIPDLRLDLQVINKIQSHRGPDDNGLFVNEKKSLGFAHQRLSIIDPKNGQQPMSNEFGLTVVFNGAIYNHIELREELNSFYSFKTLSDTETIIAAYQKWGHLCVNHFRGMFAFAIWDEKKKELFCARDRFGIKPLYYAQVGDLLIFASEVKGLLPFLDQIEPNDKALKEYLFFQMYLGQETLFNNVNQLQPAHTLSVANGKVNISKYWEIYYNLDFEHTSQYFERKTEELLNESVRLHLRSDVPVACYVSGGVDSALIAGMAKGFQNKPMNAFTGRFDEGELFDESQYAKNLCEQKELRYNELTMNHEDFIDSFEKIIYHLDYPVAGPGSFPQFKISEYVSKFNKVVLGGQGGDEIFGGYTRYLIAYFEQCIRGAIDGTLNSGNFVVTYESIIPNLTNLKNYKPLLKEFWKNGLFEDLDKRYFKLINRAPGLKSEVNWDELSDYDPFDSFSTIFNGSNVGKESYFDKMTHFDFKVLLPALLQVEDRMSMAHGVEARVPFMDHKLVEFAATVPANIKFKNGNLKRLLKESFKTEIPKEILDRKDKMGFPVPLNKWMKNEMKEYVLDIFNSKEARERPFTNADVIIDAVTNEGNFGRKVWGLLSLEKWHQTFCDRAQEFKGLRNQNNRIVL